ncbi:MAG: hypothetical protein SFU98_21940 [Leptospiraceae bacterium]|nr:hypothetical protein [Leptospiraceae bacterium]
MIIGISFFIYLIISILFSEFKLNSLIDFLSIQVVVLGISYKFFNFRFGLNSEGIFVVNSLLLNLFICTNGVYYLPLTDIPRLSLYFKLLYMINSFFILQSYVRINGIKIFFLTTLIFVTSIFNLNYFFAISLKSLPVFVYVVYYFSIQKFKKETLKVNLLDIFILLFVVIIIVSNVASYNQYRSIFQIPILLSSLAVAFVTINSNHSEIKKIIKILSISFGIQVLFLSIFIFRRIIVDGWGYSSSIAGFHVNGVGGFVALYFPIGIHLVIISRGFKRILHFLVLLLIPFIIIVCNNRSSIISITYSTIVILALKFIIHRDKTNHKQRFLIISLLLFTLTILGLYLNNKFQLVNLETLFIRFKIWKMFIVDVLENRPLIGFGAETNEINAYILSQNSSIDEIKFRKDLFQEFGLDMHSHNYIIGILFQYGFIGLVAFSILFFIIVSSAYQKVIKNFSIFHSIGITSLINMFLYGMLDYNLSEPGIIISVGVFLGIFFFKSNDKPLIEVNFEIANKIKKIVLLLAIVASVFMTVDALLLNQKILPLKPYFVFDKYGFYNLSENVPREKLVETNKLNRFTFNPINHYSYQLDGKIRERLFGDETENLIEVESDLKKAINAFPKYPYYYIELSRIQTKLGRDEAIKNFQLGKELDPLDYFVK